MISSKAVMVTDDNLRGGGEAEALIGGAKQIVDKSPGLGFKETLQSDFAVGGGSGKHVAAD